MGIWYGVVPLTIPPNESFNGWGGRRPVPDPPEDPLGDSGAAQGSSGNWIGFLRRVISEEGGRHIRILGAPEGGAETAYRATAVLGGPPWVLFNPVKKWS